MIYNNLKKIRGPYKSKKDGRERIQVDFIDGKRKTISYPKYLMELHLNRYLEENETVDHIDGNFLNNDISNLQILDRQKHATLDVYRNKDLEVNCTYCNQLFTIKGSTTHLRNRKDRSQSGYFCSRFCSGKYGSEIQNNKRILVTVDKIIPEKYQVKNLSTLEEIL
jgi:hypothetical protein